MVYIQYTDWITSLCVDVFWPTAAFRNCPVDVLAWVFDIACFAVDTVTGIDLKSFFARDCFVINVLVDTG